jgi:hypothetical protein
MLQIATAAVAEEGAGWLASSRTGLQDLDDLGPSVVGPALYESNAKSIPGRRAGNEDGDAFEPAQALPSCNQLLHFDFQLVQSGEPISCPLLMGVVGGIGMRATRALGSI